MADSSFDDFVQMLETQLADSTVLFLQGKTGKAHGKRDQARRIAIERARGTVAVSSGPVAGTGPKRMARHVRQETLRVSLYAEDEDTLDQLFDNMINAVFDICGPNAVMNDYEWGAEDSKGGGHTMRQPMIVFEFTLKLKVSPPSKLTKTITNTDLNFGIEEYES